jgi:ABC-type amino acid transport substrate-binding protein
MGDGTGATQGDSMAKLIVSTFLLLLVLFPVDASAMDTLKTFIPASDKDPRSDFYIELYQALMEATRDEYGSYEIRLVKGTPSRDRELAELIAGEVVNVDIVATRTEWEERTIPIRIPLLKGMLGIRLFLVRRGDVPLFGQIESLEALKELRMGLGKTWTITGLLKEQGFTIVTGTSYDGLFEMLDIGRFDYFPRGLNEVYEEIEAWADELPNLAVEPHLALQLPLPTFFFVSPAHPRLARRIEAGLRRMLADGSYDRLFEKHFGDLYTRARLDTRRIFTLDNPHLTRETAAAIR